MQLLTDNLEWSYFTAFLAISAMILVPWPRLIDGLPRLIVFLLSISSLFAIGWMLNKDLAFTLKTIGKYLEQISPSLMDLVKSVAPAPADLSDLWLNLLVSLLLMFVYVLFRSVAILIARVVALGYWLSAKIGLVQSGTGSHALQVAPSADFIKKGLLLAFGLMGLMYASIGFLQFTAIANWYFAPLFWVTSWIALLEFRALFVIDERQESGVLVGNPMRVIGSNSEFERFIPLKNIYDKMRADYAEHLLLGKAPDPPRPYDPGAGPYPIESDQNSAAKIGQNVRAALKDYEAGCDLAFTEALSSAHIELMGQMLLSARNFGREALILTPPGLAGAIESIMFQRFGAQYIKNSYSFHHWAISGTPTRHIDFHFCEFEAFDYFLAHNDRIDNLGLLCALEVHRANLGELRFAFQRLWQRVDSEKVSKAFQSADYYNAEPSIRYLSKTKRLVEHYLTTSTLDNKFLLVWDRPDIDRSLNERVAIKFTDSVDAAILVAKEVFDQSGLPTTWLDEPLRFDKDIHESLRAGNDMSWLAHCDNRINIDQHAYLVATEDLNNLSFAKRDSANFQQEHVYLHHIFSSNYLLRDAMADIPQVEGRLWSPVMPSVEGDLENLAHQCGQEMARQRLTQAALQTLLDLFVQQQLLKALRITASKPGLQRLFMYCHGLNSIDITHQRQSDGSTVYGFSEVQPDARLITVRDSSGVHVGSCSRNDLGLLYATQTDLFIQGINYRITAIDNEAISVAQTEASADRRRKYLFARDYSLGMPTPVTSIVDFSVGDTGVELERSLIDFTRRTVGFVDVAESMHLQDARYHRMDESETILVNRRYKNCLRLRLTRSVPRIDNVKTVEFTFAALVADALHSLFPQQSTHVAVLPSRREPRPDKHYSRDGLALFIYPQLSINDCGASPAQEEEQVVNYLEVLVLEDADGDLGVVSTLFQERTKMLEVIKCFLDWYDRRQPEHAYHHFGSKALYPGLDYANLTEFLSDFSVRRARNESDTINTPRLSEGKPRKIACCDFCGSGLDSGYDLLDDGRHRCIDCSKDALLTLEDFRTLLVQIIERMEDAYGITIRRDITAEFASANRIGEATRSPFIPTQGFDPRAVGLATRRGEHFCILIESGAPLIDSAMTIAHELTHIWQYDNLSREQLDDVELAEGQARFIEIDYTRLSGNLVRAAQFEKQMENSSDEYGRGYRKIRKQLGLRSRAYYFEQFRLS